MSRTPRALVALVVAACFACGARTSTGSSTRSEDGGAAASVTLTIPLGSYPGCMSTLLAVSAHSVATSGGAGTLTLAQENGTVVATLAFEPFASGKVAFTPTSTTSAAIAAGRSYDVETRDMTGTNLTVTETTGSLALVGDTLFVSVHGQSGSADVSGLFHCPVPASLQPTSVVTQSPPAATLTPGSFGPCTSSVDATASGVMAGAGGSVTVTESDGSLHATWTDDVTPVCKSLDFIAASHLGTLASGQTCDVKQPCGPPPTLGPSPAPSVATLSDPAGAMTVDGSSLFLDVVGETAPETCGRHYLSILCAPAGH